MTDIFLSYSRDDQSIARKFAEGFEREGLSVWWDVALNAGEDYDRVTEQALRGAKAVVVLRSRNLSANQAAPLSKHRSCKRRGESCKSLGQLSAPASTLHWRA